MPHVRKILKRAEASVLDRFLVKTMPKEKDFSEPGVSDSKEQKINYTEYVISNSEMH